jgi:hypothetical protein
VIRINHVALPPGLSAFARRIPDGDVEVFVSQALTPDRQRAAVRLALRACRRAGWRGVLLPVPVGAMLAGSRGWLGRTAVALRGHPVVSAAVATVAVTGAAVGVAVLPPQHSHAGHISAGQLPPPAAIAPVPGGTTTPSTGSPRHGQTAKPHPTPGQSESPGAGHSTTSATGHSTTPAPGASPQPTAWQSSSPASTEPSPSPQPSPTQSGGGDCITLLGVTVCL